MSLIGVMGTSISGMAAQANRLASVGDNIANSSTTGYKRSDTQFETLVGNSMTGTYESGSVLTDVRYGVTQQGALRSTASVTDLAVKGNGFFVVSDANGATHLTRSGSFVPDASGNLINPAGYKLMAYNLSTNPTASGGPAGLEVVNVAEGQLKAIPSTAGTFSGNFPSRAAIVTGSLPSTNSPSATYTAKSSLVAYDNLGGAVNLDVYLTKTADSTWEVAIFDKSTAGVGGGFPYSSGAMATQVLTFDPTSGKLSSTSANSVDVAIPNGNTVSIDLSKTTQFASDYSISTATLDGAAPSSVDHIEIGTDGTLTSVYGNGARVESYRIPLANVQSPDSLTAESGTIFMSNAASGAVSLGAAGSTGLGTIASSSLEQSTVDLATELNDMIVAQRAYQANVKVMQTAGDLLQLLTQR